MTDSFERKRYGRFTVDVFYVVSITFITVLENVDGLHSRLLLWKPHEGFTVRLILKDSASDLETSEPLECSKFPTNEIRNLILETPGGLDAVFREIVAILATFPTSSGNQ